MEIVKTSKAGTLESSDIYIILMPNEDRGIEIQLESVVMEQFGKAIENTIRTTLESLGVRNVKVMAQDRGALDYTIKARVETAVQRAAAEVLV